MVVMVFVRDDDGGGTVGCVRDDDGGGGMCSR